MVSLPMKGPVFSKREVQSYPKLIGTAQLHEDRMKLVLEHGLWGIWKQK
jgi:hypothetical protein